MENSKILLEKLGPEKNQFYESGTQLVFDEVLLLGTESYTCVGRPFVNQVRVYGTIEENSLSKKSLVFKKRRRKNS